MRNASKSLILILGALAVAACHKHGQQQAGDNQDINIEDNLTSGGAPDNADIETLPPDESSTTSSKELQNGQDNPDVNGAGNSD